MKKLRILLITSTLFYFDNSILAQTKTLENGVVVYEAIGNESSISTSIETPTNQRSIQEWNLAECIEALRLIEEKCQMISTEECLAYNQLRSEIQLRKTELEN
ncbi:MAG: hypothetical protein IT221_04345 [Fluviicola sp.]|nr:hypothetical protein [Fluviicola sp.]